MGGMEGRREKIEDGGNGREEGEDSGWWEWKGGGRR